MKTPRELLLEKHAQAVPHLDTIRQQAVSEAMRLTNPARDDTDNALSLIWQEVFVSCRRAWFGLAGVWGLILLLQLTGPADVLRQATVASSPTDSRQFVQLVEERQRWQEELLGNTTPQANSTHPAVIRPRSELAIPSRLC